MKKWIALITVISLPLFSNWDWKMGTYGTVLPLPGIGISTRITNGAHTGFELDATAGTLIVKTGFTATINYLCYLFPHSLYIGTGIGGISNTLSVFENIKENVEPMARAFIGTEFTKGFIDGGCIATYNNRELNFTPTLRFS
ncbi:MAG: hypothetical protein P0S94_00635, partial [Simkaniaceae bacterium]|nr:hypothetical protein [Simkaniaceae bacterium]